ncbi:hypothetical protein Cni_G21743 [Canna indica]|uniref:DUF4408 domain-containing protein n=1 Tax=Canna indica TaxID=4628 RepID=A0AAQ3QIZ9_9LILI|nr:hypothetical protein Cni_G21743 [Canna indica]
MDFRSRSNGGGDTWAPTATRAALVSAGVVIVAVALRFAGPSLLGFLAIAVPQAYASAVTWLRPPYLYLVINGIIISIAASSRFQKQHSAADPTPISPSSLLAMDPPPVQAQAYEAKPAEDAPSKDLHGEPKAEAVDEEGDGFVVSRLSRKTESAAEISTEYAAAAEVKPLVSTRFSHRKVAKPSPEGKALGVARRPRRNETLEGTWRAITEGRAVPLARHLKKSDTWDTHGGGDGEESAATKAAAMRKSETFKEHAAEAAPPRRLKKETSVGQEELNRRVEAFIRKFNEDMRLQRQESLRNYMEMMNRGSH